MERNGPLGALALALLTVLAASSWSARAVSPASPANVPVLRIDSAKIDPETGLVVDDQLGLVKAHCTACHSSKLILQSHFSREKWIERIRWMQRTQNLWDLGASEPAILTYLTKHYGPTGQPLDGRRQPLKPVNWHTDSSATNSAN